MMFYDGRDEEPAYDREAERAAYDAAQRADYDRMLNEEAAEMNAEAERAERRERAQLTDGPFIEGVDTEPFN